MQNGCNDQTQPFQCVTCGRQSADAADHKAVHPGKRLPTGHEIVLDLSNNETYCTVCNDYVYCPKIDREVTVSKFKHEGVGWTCTSKEILQLFYSYYSMQLQDT